MRVATPSYRPRIFLCLLSPMLLTAAAGTAAHAQIAQKTDAPGPVGVTKGMPPMEMPPGGTSRRDKTAPPGRGTTLPSLSSQKGWPSPVSDSETYSYLLFDLLEYRWNKNGSDALLRWDILAWRGGDYNRVWFKSEGSAAVSSSEGGYAEVQALYGRLIAPFTDFQVGIRYDQLWGRGRGKGRAFLAVGLQALIPYRFDIEPVLFISQDGDVSVRFTGTYNTYITQRLVLQPRFETNIAAQKRESFGQGAGINNVEIGLRLRYEIRREFAPYIGINWEQSFGQSADFARRAGEPTSQFSPVAGIRAWF